MTTALLTYWASLINTRVGSPITDATPAEVKAAMKTLRENKNATYVRTFLKPGGKWRELLDSEDILSLIFFIEYKRGH